MHFRQHAGVSLLRLSIAVISGNGILTVSSIAFPKRVRLRSRLTLIRLALIRKPWSYGEGVSRPLYRYLYLHLLFHMLQHASKHIFNAIMECSPTNYELVAIPRLRHRTYARLLSMRGRSTAELLRTL